MPNIQPVTALFDIHRSTFDGRTVDKYLTWLTATLKIFPALIIFHNFQIPGSIRRAFQDATFIEMELSELYLYSLRPIIQESCDSRNDADDADLVYLSTDYGILVNSKFEFLYLASKIQDANAYRWVDVGYSRFNYKHYLQDSSSSEYALENRFVLDLGNLIRQVWRYRSLTPRKFAPIGNSSRILSGLTFIVLAESLEEYFTKHRDYLLSILIEQEWDTEQITIFHCLVSLRPRLSFEIFNRYELLMVKHSHVVELRNSFLEWVVYKTIFNTTHIY